MKAHPMTQSEFLIKQQELKEWYLSEIEKAKTTYCYLIFDGSRYKIGKATDPRRRIKQIRTSNPDARLLCFGCNVDEQYLHEKYKSNRYCGEWFNFNEAEVLNVMLDIRGRFDDIKKTPEPQSGINEIKDEYIKKWWHNTNMNL